MNTTTDSNPTTAPDARYCDYGTEPGPDPGIWEVNRIPLGKKAIFRPGGDAKLKSILTAAAVSGADYVWRDFHGNKNRADPLDLAERLGWFMVREKVGQIKAGKARLKVKSPPRPKARLEPKSIKAKADKPEVILVTEKDISLESAISYSAALKNGMEVVKFAANKHFKTNTSLYNRATIDIDDVIQHLYSEVLVPKYLKEIEDGFPWFIKRQKSPWDLPGFRSSLYKACWRACLAYHRKHIAAQKRSPGLLDGSVFSLDANSATEEDDPNEILLSGELQESDSNVYKRMVNSLNAMEKSLDGHHILKIPMRLAVFLLYRLSMKHAEGMTSAFKSSESYIKEESKRLQSDLYQYFPQAWEIITAHVERFLDNRCRCETQVGGLRRTYAPDTMDRVYECPDCTVETNVKGVLSVKPRKLAVYECHREGGSLFCPCGAILETTTWVSRK